MPLSSLAYVTCRLAHACAGLLQKLEETLEPILYLYKQSRKPQEPFGDFCARVGFEALRRYSKSFVGKAAEEKLPQVRLGQTNLDAVQALADKQVYCTTSFSSPTKPHLTLCLSIVLSSTLLGAVVLVQNHVVGISLAGHAYSSFPDCLQASTICILVAAAWVECFLLSPKQDCRFFMTPKLVYRTSCSLLYVSKSTALLRKFMNGLGSWRFHECIRLIIDHGVCRANH